MNPMLKVEIKKKKKRRRLGCWKVKLRKKSIKNDKKTESTHQTCGSGHGVGIAP
jgi:hypothetical protein